MKNTVSTVVTAAVCALIAAAMCCRAGEVAGFWLQ